MYAEKDKARKDVIEAKNEADTLIYSSEKSRDEHKANLASEVVQSIDTALAELRAVLDSEDAVSIKEKTDALRQAVMKIGESLNKQAPPSEGGDNTDSSK